MTTEVLHSQLPRGWAIATIGEIYEIIGGGTPSTKNENFWNGDIPWISSADIISTTEVRPRKYITKEAIENSATNLVPEGSVIVVTRVGLGKVTLTKTPLCFSQDSQALIPKGEIILPEYSLDYLSVATKKFKSMSRGTTIEGITKNQLSALTIALPPIAEQRRIVARINILFNQINECVNALNKIQAVLEYDSSEKISGEKLRDAILKQAFEGKLVPQDPNDEPASVLLSRIKAEKPTGKSRQGRIV